MILYIQVSQVEFLFRACQTHFLDADETDLAVFEWYFLELFIQPKTWRRIFKSWWCFQISSSSFPTFAPSQNKKSPSRIYFLRRRFFSTSENSCHSLHEYCNSLIFNFSLCNDKQKCHVTDVTFAIEWHQWHAKNKHIARGNVDIQRFMMSVQWVQWIL